MDMLRTFKQFNIINEGAVAPYDPDLTLISQESSSWNSAVNYFKKETGKDLTNFKWVFNNNDTQDGIWPQNYIIALMSASPVLSKHKALIDYLKDFFSQRNMSYESGNGVDYVRPGSNSLMNSKALFNIWTKYFYEPIKRAAESNNFDSINAQGMEDFEERMHIFTMDYDSDWTQFFSSLKLVLQSGPSGQAQQAQPQQATPSSATKPKRTAQRTASDESDFIMPKFKK